MVYKPALYKPTGGVAVAIAIRVSLAYTLRGVAVIAMMFAASSQAAEELAMVSISDLRPTQAFIAHDQVNYKLQRYAVDRRKLFDDLCEVYGRGDRAEITDTSVPQDITSFSCRLSAQTAYAPQTMKTAVRGPGGAYYLTDGHHTFSTFHDFMETGPDFVVPVRVTHDQSSLSANDFWRWLQDNRLTWLQDANGETITPAQLPAQLGRANLGNDVWRGAMYFLRDMVWAKPDPAIPFVEFYWAQQLRAQPWLQPPELNSAPAYLLWLERLGGHIMALPPELTLGPQGQNADALGRLPGTSSWQLGELLCEGTDIGKLALALAARGVASDCRLFGGEPDAAPILAAAESRSEDAAESDLLLAVIEIPAGSHEKWQMDKAAPGLLEWERVGDDLRVINYLPYPANYGALPGTLAAREEGGDGDPLDVLVLGPALPRGTSVPVRVIARMSMLDDGERDDKLIAVVPDDNPFAQLNDLADLQAQFPGVSDILMIWFQNYKGASGNVTELALEEFRQEQ